MFQIWRIFYEFTIKTFPHSVNKLRDYNLSIINKYAFIQLNLICQMEQYIVSARKYRPQTFHTVVGQEHITNTLKNAIKNHHLAQAFLFCGPRGVGKTTCARILAKTINCTAVTNETEACDQCESCKSFNSGQSLNVHELDAASNNSVDDIRNLVDQVRFAPQLGDFKVDIIDEVHMLSTSAFNAFLKTLEEPPKHAIFILATTEKHKIIPTILSRCQIFDFNRIKIDDISKHLGWIAKTEGISAEDDALHVIAQKADGGLRDACSMFDQMVSFSGNNLTYKVVVENLHVLDYDYYFQITDALNNQQLPTALLAFDEILKKGFDGHNFIVGLGEHFRNLLVCKDAITLQLLEVSQNVKEKYGQQAVSCSMPFLLKALGIVNRSDVSYKAAKNQRLQVEIALMQMSYLNAAPLDAEKKNDSDEIVQNNTQQKVEKKLVVETEVKPAQLTTDRPINSNKEIQINSGFRLNEAHKVVSGNPVVASLTTEEKIVVTKENISFTAANLTIVIKKFATHKLESAGLKQLHSMLTSRPVEIMDGTKLVLTVSNDVQRELFKPVSQEFLDYLRKELSNSQITLEILDEEVPQTDLKAYSPMEKFENMVKRNSSLLELKKRFDLEVDY